MKQSHRTKNTIPRIIYRYVSGRHLATPSTDSTWRYPATQALTTHGRASAWARMPGYRRQLWRHGIAATSIAGVYGYAHEPLTTELTGSGLVVAGSVWGGMRAVKAVKVRHHNRDWVTPLRKSVVVSLYPNGNAPKDVVHVPLDVHDEGEVRIELPGYLGKDKRTELADIVQLKLGMSQDTITEWKFSGKDQYLSVRRLPLPPVRVSMSDVLSAMESAPESQPVMGLGRRNRVVSVDLDSEAPHILVSASTGGGKSVIVRSLVAQLMRNGSQVTFLDIKRQSHRWARNLPGVRYCRDIPDIHEALLDMGNEGERRNRLTDDIPDDVDTTKLDVGARQVLVCEEMNGMISRLQSYWQEIKPKGGPNISPAIKALGEVLYMGRAVKINVIAVGQLLTARALGGPEMRECFGCRILARASNNAWKMLAPEIQPIPKKSRHVGRIHVVIGGEDYETQGLFLTDQEAKDWASAGPVTVPESWSNANGSRTGASAKPKLMTLSELVSSETVPIPFSTLRTHKRRDKAFPEPVGKRGERDTYDPVEVAQWWSNRTSVKG